MKKILSIVFCFILVFLVSACKKNNNNTENMINLSAFPSFYIYTENKQSIVSKDDYIKCTISVSNTTETYCLEEESAKIKGRGNSTWSLDKKPYKLKFENKINLFGNGKSKTWTIIANHSDPSLIRNHMAYKIADTFNTMEYTTKFQTVNLYLNDKYEGVYLICEQNETGENRVDIDEDLEKLDTGYLVEMDARAPEEGVQGLDYFTIDSINYAIKGPDTEDEDFTANHCDFIKSYFESAYNAILSNDFIQVCNYIDIESFVDSYIIHELFSTVDVGFSSFYFNKEASGKIKSGPLWDFDISVGNCNYHENAIKEDYLWAKETNIWYKGLLNYDEFKELIKNRLELIDYKMLITDEINVILSNEKSYVKNFERWDILGTYIWPNTQELIEIKTWRGQVEYVQNWLITKLNFMINEYVK